MRWVMPALYLLVVTAVCLNASSTDANNHQRLLSLPSANPFAGVQIFEGPEDHSPRLPVHFDLLARKVPGEVQVVGGEKLDSNSFPATVQSQAAASCTATLIGPQVLLTAAHCVDAAQKLSSGFPMTVSGTATFDRPYDLENCAMPDAYAKANPTYTLRPRTAEDWALCKLKSRPTGVRPEVVSLTPPAANSTRYFMLGFGCSKVERKGGTLVGVDQEGVLRAGTDTLEAVNVGLAGNVGGFAVALAGITGPSLCPGDSGGGSMTGIDLKSVTAPRSVSMINSALGSTGEGKDLLLYSYFAPLGTGLFEAFARGWATSDPERRICGIHIPREQAPCRA